MATALSEFSTCEVSDALIKLKIPHGGYLPDVKMLTPGEQYAAFKLRKLTTVQERYAVQHTQSRWSWRPTPHRPSLKGVTSWMESPVVMLSSSTPQLVSLLPAWSQTTSTQPISEQRPRTQYGAGSCPQEQSREEPQEWSYQETYATSLNTVLSSFRSLPEGIRRSDKAPLHVYRR